MISLIDLWMPILLSAVLVFVVSSILHMLIPIHKGDYIKLPAEEPVVDALRKQNLRLGNYMIPGANSMKDMCTPEMIEKYTRGPVGILTIVPSGPPRMGKSLVIWFLYSVIIGVFIAYAAMLSLERGAAYMTVFRVTGTIALLPYAVGAMPDSIWKGQRWGVTLKHVFDGILYGLVTAGTFAWLWPAAA